MKDLFPGLPGIEFDDAQFDHWWVTPQPLLGGKAPSQTSADEIENLIAAAENYHASKKGTGQ